MNLQIRYKFEREKRKLIYYVHFKTKQLIKRQEQNLIMEYILGYGFINLCMSSLFSNLSSIVLNKHCSDKINLNKQIDLVNIKNQRKNPVQQVNELFQSQFWNMKANNTQLIFISCDLIYNQSNLRCFQLLFLNLVIILSKEI
ncbi:hypothetical protein pb186bvf_014178 [Paramecium bursaria]